MFRRRADSGTGRPPSVTEAAGATAIVMMLPSRSRRVTLHDYRIDRGPDELRPEEVAAERAGQR